MLAKTLEALEAFANGQNICNFRCDCYAATENIVTVFVN
jgi:nitric oxide reductase activation protein